MSIQELVPSREICEQLKQAGFPQETCFYFCERVEGNFLLLDTDQKNHYKEWRNGLLQVFAAPTAEEILSQLNACDIAKFEDRYQVWSNDPDNQQSTAVGKTLVEAVAKIFIYLKSNNLL